MGKGAGLTRRVPGGHLRYVGRQVPPNGLDMRAPDGTQWSAWALPDGIGLIESPVSEHLPYVVTSSGCSCGRHGCIHADIALYAATHGLPVADYRQESTEKRRLVHFFDDDAVLLAVGDAAWTWAASSDTARFPVPSPDLQGVHDIQSGDAHSLAVRFDGRVISRGNNTAGQIGDRPLEDSAVWGVVPGLSEVIEVAAAFRSSLALRADGTVWGWGLSRYGIVPEHSGTCPTRIDGLDDIIHLSARSLHALALRRDGTVLAWGFHDGTILGTGESVHFSGCPRPVLTLHDIIEISTGGNHSHALDAQGTMWSWGYNAEGSVGDGSLVNRSRPVRNEIPGSVSHIASGLGQSLALTSAGIVYAWGASANALGVGRVGTNVKSPRPVRSLDMVHTIHAGCGMNAAVLRSGDVVTWGYPQTDSRAKRQVAQPTTIPGIRMTAAN